MKPLMNPRLFAWVIAAALLVPGTAMAQDELNFQRDVAGATTDPTSRDNLTLNPATISEERAIEQDSDARSGRRVHPDHEVIIKNHNGIATPTDVYMIPPTAAERDDALDH